ncbi:MAG: molecular chaperone TorD family protein [Chloroflexi bacterium]|nr:molecular chaperone TorD family protein [Chloroflexota bacterium]
MNTHWAEQFIAHQLAYSFLSKALYEPPDPEFMSVLTGQELFADWPLDSSDVDTLTGLGLLRDFCRQWDESQTFALKQDYSRLFLGPSALLAPPWESVYRSPDHLMFEKQTLEVRHEFSRFGMRIPNLTTEPEDHIGLELRFIAYLCGAGLSAIERDDAKQFSIITQEIQHFLKEHLLQWADECLTRIIEHSQGDYYRGVAMLTRGTLAHTSRHFEVLLKERA